MYQRSRKQNLSPDWDPMRDEYDQSTFAPQYQDDNTSADGVQLDHSKLYVTNISRALNKDGLRSIFSKYGNCHKVFLSNDPAKRYALVFYETSSEAKLAMMKLNRTEPLQLHINIAHKKSNQDTQNQRSSYNARDSCYQDDGETSSRGRYSRKQDEFSNGDNNDTEDFVGDDDMDLDDGLDPNLELELEELKLKHLKLQEAQIHCKQRMLLLNRIGKSTAQRPATNRCMLPDGRIVVRNTNDRSEHQDNTTATGDSPPALQRSASRACLACAAPADLYCAGCALAPYCGPRCQRADWARRHRAVCHNLALLSENAVKSKDKEVDAVVVPPPHSVPSVQGAPAAPLRRPHLTQNTKNIKKDENDKIVKNVAQNKSHRNNSNFKNQTLRRPMQQLNDSNRDEEEESFEPKDTKPSQEVAPKEERKPQIPTTSQQNSSDHPVTPEPEVPKATKGPEVNPSSLATVQDVTPVKKMIPKHYVVETLSAGQVVLLSVDAAAADCESETGRYVCLALTDSSEADYQLLCDEYSKECELDGEEYRPRPGEVFSHRSAEDGAWYRARLLAARRAALLDCSRVVAAAPPAACRRLADRYQAIPEFCCALDADNVKIGESLKGTLVSKSADCIKVSLENAETGASVGEGVITRWRPRVEYPCPKNSTPAAIPAVERPPLARGSRVLLARAGAGGVLVRPAGRDARREHDALVEDVLEYALTAPPTPAPPQKGDVVVARSSDGSVGRALCKRTNVAQNKYLLEYIEHGNTEINTRETIHACPPELSPRRRPTLVSLVKLQLSVQGLTAAAEEYLERLRGDGTELTLTIADGSESAPSGAEVTLSVCKSGESVNRTLERLCTPGWKKIEESGGDVIHLPPLKFTDLEHLPLPAGGCVLDVLDVSVLSCGSVNACVKDLPYARTVFTTLTEQMAEYCNSEIGKEPYLPNMEELCIAQCPPYPQWFRGVVCERAGPGAATARVCFVDYGNIDDVPAAALRKMLPDFVRGLPALAAHVELRGFPKEPTTEMLMKAMTHMKVNDEGRGELAVTRCEKVDEGFYVADAPELLKAIGC